MATGIWITVGRVIASEKLIPDSCRIRLGIFDSKSFKNGHSRPLFLYFRLFNTVESKY